MPIRWVVIRDPKCVFKTQALLATDLSFTPEQIVQWFTLRWRLEVTFHEVCEHLGVETQRQWSDLAILRTTPVLLALFSLVTLLAGPLTHEPALPVRQAVWYRTPLPTVADALAIVRRHLWTATPFDLSPAKTARVEIPGALLNRLTETLCYAA